MRIRSILGLWTIGSLVAAACTPPRPAEPDVVTDAPVIAADMGTFDVPSVDVPDTFAPRPDVPSEFDVVDATMNVDQPMVSIDAEPDAAPIREAGAVCSDDLQCNDAVFCNGRERCAPGIPGADVRGCVRAVVLACRPEQMCNEAMGRCVTDCMASGDADGDGVRAVECGGLDCDDSDRLRRPGAAEVCDPDNRDEDCNPLTFGTRDRDGDGFTDRTCCNVDGVGIRTCGTDCNDFRRAQSPGALEVCNGLDEDCDGVADNGVTQAFFPDRDFDLYGARGAVQVQACAGLRGYSLADLDCDDDDPGVSSPQPEFCDGRDNNCNGMVDERSQPVRWYPDEDGDGFGVERGAISSCTVPDPRARWVLRAGDCDDGDSTINPTAAEICDGRDNNCNGRAEFRIGAGDYEDDDGDGAADVRCAGFGTDCNDNNPEIYASYVNARGMRVPSAAEICDGLDNDCNSMIDDRRDNVAWYPDRDGDGFGDTMVGPVMSCMIPPGLVRNDRDCDDANPNRNPLVLDPCNGIDDDCDGTIDEDAAKVVWFRDRDRDGIGGSVTTAFACQRPSADAMGGWSDRGDDCNDMDSMAYPGAAERCNMQDDNCDGMADNGALVTFYEDADRDGHGSMAPGRRTSMACVAPMGFAAIADDCDDGDIRRFPGNVDICDSIDNDCNGVVDQAATADLACARPHATSTCAMGRCSALACDVAYADCNGANADGCEINIRTLANCGGCGLNCARANAVAECGSGVCRVDSCQPAFANCDANEANGCETATNSASNCGRCGVLCPGGANCMANMGGFACVCPGANGTVCGGACVDIGRDALNCGACGNVCAIGATCSAIIGVTACRCPVIAATVCGGRCIDTTSDRNNCGGCGRACETTCTNGVCRRAIGLATGARQTCIMLDDAERSVRCWGDGGYTGDGTGVQRLVQVAVNAPWAGLMPPRVPLEISSGVMATTTVARVAVAGNPDEVWYWGARVEPLGPPVSVQSPIQSMTLSAPIDALSFSDNHLCFTRSGTVLCYGANSFGQCGRPASGNIAVPTVVAGINSAREVRTAIGATAVLRTNGTAYLWGLGAGTHVPQLLAIGGETMATIALTASNPEVRFVAVTDSGLVAIAEYSPNLSFCAGGCGPLPTIVPLAAGELAETQIAATNGAVCVVLRAPLGAVGEVRCRGYNNLNQLGDGTSGSSETDWVTVLRAPGTPLRGVNRISAGDESFCVTTVNGAVFCWGSNNRGQHGSGALGNHAYATPILWP